MPWADRQNGVQWYRKHVALPSNVSPLINEWRAFSAAFAFLLPFVMGHTHHTWAAIRGHQWQQRFCHVCKGGNIHMHSLIAWEEVDNSLDENVNIQDANTALRFAQAQWPCFTFWVLEKQRRFREDVLARRAWGVSVTRLSITRTTFKRMHQALML